MKVKLEEGINKTKESKGTLEKLIFSFKRVLI
jgi:hypothetical protein